VRIAGIITNDDRESLAFVKRVALRTRFYVERQTANDQKTASNNPIDFSHNAFGMQVGRNIFRPYALHHHFTMNR
jgi:hypothetical protein